MQIKSFTIQGFRSFVDQQEFSFTALRPGLYHLAGVNEVEPALQGNGAGKSSLLEAVCWLAYGTTSRKLKAASVGNWGSKAQCGGILEVKTAQHDLGIFRTWNPNTLEVSIDGAAPRPVEQKELDALLGLPFDAYLFSIYFAQFSPAFIDLRPSEQMSVFSSVMGLTLWEQAGDAASKKGRELEAVVQRYREALAGVEGQLIELTTTTSELDAEERAWLESMATKEEVLTKTQEEERVALVAAEHKREKVVAGSTKSRELREKVELAARAVCVAEVEVNRLEREIAQLLGKENITKCPVCGGAITIVHLKGEKKKKEETYAKAKSEMNAAINLHNERTKEMDKFRDAEVDMLDAEKAVATLSARLKATETALANLMREENPFDDRRRNAQDRVTALQERVAKGKAEVDRSAAQQGAAQFWAKGFKELRLSLIEESLAQLTIEANSALVELGLQDWALGFDVERETKSGGVSKGFTVSVTAPHVKGAVPWECWSGGEGQRLRVAVSLGFSELICSRMGLQPNTELWDEPSTWLSEAGIHDLLGSLADRAERRGKVIVLADHRALDFGGFAGTINVVKTGKGSRVSVAV